MLCPNCLQQVRFEKSGEDIIEYSCPHCNKIVSTRYIIDYYTHTPAAMALIGMKTHGKTCYLASLFNKLEDISSKWKGFSIAALDESGLDKLREIQNSLRGKEVPDATNKVLPTPTVVSLNRVPGYGNFHLICYDISGEAFEKEESILNYGDYLSRVETVIWLIDLSCPATEDQDKKRGTQFVVEGVSVKLSNMVTIYSSAIGRLNKNTKDQRLLVVLTKADRLEGSLPKRIQNYLHHENYNRRELNRVSDEIKSWLKNNYKLGNFVNLLDENFKEVKYTVLSALGSEPQPKGKLLAITPRRVLEPLMFVIDCEKIKIRAEKKKKLYKIAGKLILLLLILSFFAFLIIRNEKKITYFGELTKQTILERKIHLYEIKKIEGHESFVNSVCLSFDNSHILSGSQDGTVRIWDAVSGKQIKVMSGHNSGVTGVAFSPDGKVLASSGQDGTVRIWDAGSGKQLRILTRHNDSAMCVAFSPDGQLLASGDQDGQIFLWDAASGNQLRKITGHEAGIFSVSFDNSGRLIASGSADRAILIRDVISGEELLRNLDHDKSVTCVRFSPDGRYLASGSADNTIRVVEMPNGQFIAQLRGHEDWVRDICWIKDSYYLVSGSSDNTIRIWNIITGKEILKVVSHSLGVISMATSLDGKYLVSGGGDNKIILWRLN